MILLARMLRTTVDANDVAKLLGINPEEMKDALYRIKGKPKPKADRRKQKRVVRHGKYNFAPRLPEPGEKWCGYHRAFHPIENFANKRASSDGKQTYCRAALSELNRIRYQRLQQQRQRAQ